MKQGCDLEKCFLCRNSLPEWREAICTHKKNLKFKKGERLFSEGDEVKGIYFVYSGIVKVHQKWGDGKEMTIRFASDGGIIGHRDFFPGNTYSVSASAVEPVVVCYFEVDFFKTSLKVNHQLTYNLMLFFAQELGEAEQTMRDMAAMPVKERLKKALIKLKHQFGTDGKGYINIKLPRQDIAYYTGTTYETIFRTLNEMRDEGLVVMDGKRIGLSDDKIKAK
ncbi:MAG TPA: Crp/Fnr family transcriptional regulator [Mucilaginibacter sp.]|nr:Crp/Fnr family transcriptional regulator [Mucilaginibacter sp.]